MSPEQRAALGARLDAMAAAELPPEPEHDGNYWRGALGVIAERQNRIAQDIREHHAALFELEQAQILTDKARRDAVMDSRNVLTRGEVGRILSVTPGRITATIRDTMRRRGMGVQG